MESKISFCDDYVRSLKAAKKLPMAIKWALDQFMTRVCFPCFHALLLYRNLRKWKKSLKKKGENQFKRYKNMISARKIWNNKILKIKIRHAYKMAEICFQRYPRLLCLRKRLPANVIKRKKWRNDLKLVNKFFLGCLWMKMKSGCIGRKKWRLLNLQAELARDKKIQSTAFFGWKKYATFAKNIDEYMWQKYCDRLMRKAIKGFLLNIAECKENRRQLQTRIEAHLLAMQKEAKNEEEREKMKKEAEEKMKQTLLLVTKFQAIIRRKLQQARYKKLLISAEWATQTLQNFARVALARKQWKKYGEKDLNQ